MSRLDHYVRAEYGSLSYPNPDFKIRISLSKFYDSGRFDKLATHSNSRHRNRIAGFGGMHARPTLTVRFRI